ncbi:ABC transporter permease subunit [Undibacterium cyanobacteriorum]|uniref:ABC transporter permease subunit n=1 Tax=Undibacterium cyanobacteriorum TaxID=3073561 RepID=A0ABY9RJT9_9BURK|nr:ABC transporter permease [Undibacterium sp. 20NA77.5]WMW81485.1 ABC transporter permease subunit [Undibacterium sp. 20NA77.5]
MREVLAIYWKEISDAMRDRRTLMMVLASSLLLVPVLLFVFSTVMSQVESQAVDRTVTAVNIKDAPSLENYILRQGYEIKTAPVDYEEKSRSKELIKPVLLVPENFELDLQSAKRVELEIAFDTSNRQAEMGLGPLRQLLAGYARERSSLDLMMRGVSPDLLQSISVKERHISRPDERRVTITAMLPMVLIMAIVMGGMFAAIDSTAGERERGSLEPLMMNPVSGFQLAIGKTAAVASVSILIVILTVSSFFPAQAVIGNEALRAEFQFGMKDALAFLIVLIPLAGALSSLQIAISLTCKSFKEANVRNQLLSLAVSFMPMFFIVNPGKEPAWLTWVPVMAQTQMMNQVLKGEAVATSSFAIAIVVALCIMTASLIFVSKKMREVVAQ